MAVDLSNALSQIFVFIGSAVGDLLDLISNIYVLPNVSVLHLLIAVAILGMIISAVFVLFDGGVDDD